MDCAITDVVLSLSNETRYVETEKSERHILI